MSLSKRTEIIISLAILAGAGLVIAAILNFGVERNWIARDENWKEDLRSIRNLGPKGKLVATLTALASLSFVILSIRTVVRDGNSPMTYLSIAVMIPLVVSIAFRRLAKPHEAQ